MALHRISYLQLQLLNATLRNNTVTTLRVGYAKKVGKCNSVRCHETSHSPHRLQ